MPFTSVTGASSVIKPGVVTSSTRPSNPYVGQLIFETDTNRLAVYNGSSWIMLADADTPPGLELVKTQTIGTAVTSVEVTSAFSSTYDNYLITLNGGVASTTVDLGMQLGSQTTGYYGFLVYGSANGNSVSGEGNNNVSNFKYFGGGTTAGLDAYVVVKNPFLTTQTTLISQTTRPGTITNMAYSSYSAYNSATTSFTSFTISPNTGTLTGGTIRVYGYRNS